MSASPSVLGPELAAPVAPATRAAGPASPVAAASASSPGPAPVLTALARALSDAPLDAAASALADHLATTLGMERVSVGLLRRGRVRLLAVSGAHDWQDRQPLPRALRSAMSESVDYPELRLHPSPGHAATLSLPGHLELARLGNSAALCSVPIVAAGETLGAFVFERGAPFDEPTVQAVRDIAMFVGPTLAYRQRALQLRLSLAGRGTTADGGAAARPAWLLPIAGAAVLLAVGLAWPVTQRVSAPARIEGTLQQVLAAPTDGYIGEVLVRPGAVVAADQPLLRLQTQDLAAERDRLTGEVAQLDKSYREAMVAGDAGPMVEAQARLAQARAALELTERQIDRSTLRSPVAGELIAGDLQQQVGQPVHRGDALLTVAVAGERRVVLEVDERDVGQLRVGQEAQALFAGLENTPVRFEVQRISPVATQAEGRNVFEVEGTPVLDDAATARQLRHGLRGVGRVVVGDSGLAVQWWQRLSGALRAFSWRWLG